MIKSVDSRRCVFFGRPCRVGVCIIVYGVNIILKVLKMDTDDNKRIIINTDYIRRQCTKGSANEV